MLVLQSTNKQIRKKTTLFLQRTHYDGHTTKSSQATDAKPDIPLHHDELSILQRK